MMTFGLAVYPFHADRDRGPEPRSAEPTNILSQIEARAETEKILPRPNPTLESSEGNTSVCVMRDFAESIHAESHYGVDRGNLLDAFRELWSGMRTLLSVPLRGPSVSAVVCIDALSVSA